ncbi:hypothetical protein JTB14_002467 [Gonioctena quinquepunctata]|nr:hypothetical protein JTB14_002467 [Gonioctena quinquepunctata]
MASKRPKNPSKLTDEELKQYHEEYLDLDDGLPLFGDSSDEGDLLEELDFEPDVIDAAAVEPQDDHFDVADLSLLPVYYYKRPIHSTKWTSRNIIRQGLGLSEYSKSSETMVEVFFLLLTNNILEIIGEKTNENAILEYEKWNEKHPEN